MNDSVEKTIIEYEERLRFAMLQSDVNALEELLAPELIFTNHLGQILTKSDDILAHKSGKLKINTLTLSESKVQVVGHVANAANIAIVSVRTYIIGRYADTSSTADFRFTRVWTLSSDDIWQVVAGHSSIIT